MSVVIATLLLIVGLGLAGMALLVQYLNPEPKRLPWGFLVAAVLCVVLAQLVVQRWPC